MSYHIVSIDSPQCSLSCKDGQLTCKSADGEKKLPLEDVASIIITSFSASIHSELFLEAAKHGVALIICESFKPVISRWVNLFCPPRFWNQGKAIVTSLRRGDG